MLLYSRTAQNIDGDWVAIGVWRFGTLMFVISDSTGYEQDGRMGGLGGGAERARGVVDGHVRREVCFSHVGKMVQSSLTHSMPSAGAELDTISYSLQMKGAAETRGRPRARPAAWRAGEAGGAALPPPPSYIHCRG